jgi:TPR repeat protein
MRRPHLRLLYPTNLLTDSDIDEILEGIWKLLYRQCESGVISSDNKILLVKRGVFKLAIDTLSSQHSCEVHAAVCMALTGLVFKNIQNQSVLHSSNIRTVLDLITLTCDKFLEDRDEKLFEERDEKRDDYREKELSIETEIIDAELNTYRDRKLHSAHKNNMSIMYLLESVAFLVSNMPGNFSIDIYEDKLSIIKNKTKVILSMTQYAIILKTSYMFLRCSISAPCRWYSGMLYSTMGRLITESQCCKPYHMKLALWFHDQAVVLDMMDSQSYLSLVRQEEGDPYEELTRRDCMVLGELGVDEFHFKYPKMVIGCNGLKSIDKNTNMGRFYSILALTLKHNQNITTNVPWKSKCDKIIWWLFYRSSVYGDPIGTYNLSQCYLSGFGVAKHNPLGFQALKKTSSLNYVAAMLTISSIMHKSQLDYEAILEQLTYEFKALNKYHSKLYWTKSEYCAMLYKKVAKLPSANSETKNSANLKLVECYKYGIGVKVNLMQACIHAKLTSKATALLYDIRVCGCCGIRGIVTKYCSGCLRICYCSVVCKKDHWKTHQALCDYVV